MTENNFLHVVGAIIRVDDKVLACRRAPHKSAAGKWEFPGGKVDSGEASHEALIREIYEELGSICQPVKTFDVSDTIVGNQVIRLETIFCKISNIHDLKSTDHDAFAWVSANEAQELDWAMPDLPALNLLIRDQLI